MSSQYIRVWTYAAAETRQVNVHVQDERLQERKESVKGRTRNVAGKKRVIGRLRGIFMCVCARSHGQRGTVGMNLTQIKIENRSV